MNRNIIGDRLKKYTFSSLEEEEDALKEILQEIILYGLANAEFFKHAIFQGGTSLRILYGLPRFSEDLDFLLKKPNKHFVWKPYLEAITDTCKEFGVIPEVTDKSQAGKTIQKMFLNDNSIGKIIDLTFKHFHNKKLAIKLEIDTNPPAGSELETKFLEFPLDYSIQIQNLPSNFSGKIHALLCRDYIKGRDWYDFAWYVSQKIKPNLKLLANALKQHGSWQNKKLTITPQWLNENLATRIQEIDWKKTSADVVPFLRNPEKQSLKLWSNEFFLDKLDKLYPNVSQ